MKYYLFIFLYFVSIIGCVRSGSKNKDQVMLAENTSNNDTTMSNKIKITINDQTFNAKLFDNNSAIAFKEMLPITITMIELNGNEKYYDLPNNLTTNSTNSGTIQHGDLMLYGSSTLVLFYKTFSTSYSYTELGRIDNPSDLASALGTGNVTVVFEVQ